MKAIISITICLLWLYLAGLQAQDDVYYTPEKKTGKQTEQQTDNSNDSINSGFVFIDGRYIDAPYKVERCNDLGICINGIQIEKPLEWPIVNKEAFDTHPGYPQIDKYVSIDEGFSAKEPYKNVLYTSAAIRYFYTHFEYDSAYVMVEEYFRNLPFVQSLEKVEGSELTWSIKSFSGEQQNISFGGPQAIQLNSQWGPNGCGSPAKDKLIEDINTKIEQYGKGLDKGFLWLYFTGEHESYHVIRNSTEILQEIFNIMNKNISETEKVEKLMSLKIFSKQKRNYAESFVRGYNASRQLEIRIEKLGFEKNENINKQLPNELKNEENDMNYNIDNKKLKPDNRADNSNHIQGTTTNKSLTGANTSYSPDGGVVNVACPYPYDPAFTEFNAEVDVLVAAVNFDQDFSVPNEFVDATDEDDDPGDFTYANFLNLKKFRLFIFIMSW